MLAILVIFGKQYIVRKGDVIKVENLNSIKRSTFVFKTILMLYNNLIGIRIGSPYITRAEVACKLIRIEKSDKVIIFKKKRRKNYKRKMGFRNKYIYLKINFINIKYGD